VVVDHLSRTAVTGGLQRRTTDGTGSWPTLVPRAEALALLPAGVYRAGTSRCRWCALTAPLHPYLIPSGKRPGHRRCVSVALSSRFPALGVTQQAWPLGSPDFPQPVPRIPRGELQGSWARGGGRSRSPHLLSSTNFRSGPRSDGVACEKSQTLLRLPGWAGGLEPPESRSG